LEFVLAEGGKEAGVRLVIGAVSTLKEGRDVGVVTGTGITEGAAAEATAAAGASV
jgi:hypothetical protein